MSEGMSEEVKVNCKNCSERVPLGKFCKECGGKLETDGGINDGPRPPIQASDATSTEVNSKVSSQLNNNTSTNISETTSNSDTHQNASTAITSTITGPSYADKLKSSSPQQNQQYTLPGNITTEFPTGVHSQPSWDKRGEPTIERSRHSQHGTATQINRIPENERDTLREVCIYYTDIFNYRLLSRKL